MITDKKQIVKINDKLRSIAGQIFADDFILLNKYDESQLIDGLADIYVYANGALYKLQQLADKKYSEFNSVGSLTIYDVEDYENIMDIDIPEDIVKFNKDRLLTEYKDLVEHQNIYEELREIVAEEKYTKDETKELREFYTGMYYEGSQPRNFNELVELTEVFLDIREKAKEAIELAGYDFECVKGEVLKEISSRVGSIKDGKFVKEITGNEYQADFTKCRREDETK